MSDHRNFHTHNHLAWQEQDEREADIFIRGVITGAVYVGLIGLIVWWLI